MDETHDDYFEVDLAGNYTFVNDAWCRSVGYTAEELIGMNYKVTNASDDIERTYKAFNQVYLTGQPTKALTTKFVRKDGSLGVGELSAFPMRNESGEMVGFRGVSRDITEHKRAEEALRQSEEKYRTVLEGMAESCYEVDLAGNLTFFNSALYRGLGYSREEMLRINYRVYTPPEIVEKVFQAYHQVYVTGKPIIGFPMGQIRKDGTRLIVENSVFPMRNEKGEVVGFRGIGRDVTERVQMQEALRQSEERYRTIMDEIHDDYYENDLAGNYTFVNDALCRSLGYTMEELIGMNSRAIHTPEESKKIYEEYKKLYRTGQPIKAISSTFVRKDGSHGFAEISAFPMRNESGEIVGFRGVSHDVTERVRMEEALRQSEERYRTILAEIEEGYYEVDLAGNIKFVNKAACRQFGYAEEELIGSNYRAYVLKEDIKGVYKAWNKVYRTGEPLKSYPFATVRKDGTQMFVENSVSPLRDKEGKIVGFRAVSRDVTEHKQYEQKIAEMATHDSLTGLPNRTLLSDRLTMGLALSRRSGNRLAVLMLDLDKFKTINDTMGHGVGDQLLKAVAERLTSVTRKSDTIARIGGDEFVLVLPQVCQPANASRLAQRILDVFREPLVFDGHQLNITTSIGIAVYPEDGKDIEILLKNADTAMYRAKEQGRDMYRFYGGDATKTGTKAQKSV
jgi:diguanylate cyclase (GGDEF)-like protein/PAS domain S-box-containing protein